MRDEYIQGRKDGLPRSLDSNDTLSEVANVPVKEQLVFVILFI